MDDFGIYIPTAAYIEGAVFFVAVVVVLAGIFYVTFVQRSDP